ERLTESLTTTLKQGGGRVIITDIDDGDWHDQPFNTVLECPVCRIALPELEPRLFSFNNPSGACPRCTGYGQVWESGLTDDGSKEKDPEANEDVLREALEEQAEFIPCPECGGARLGRAARAVKFAGKSVPEIMALTVEEALLFFQEMN